ncbi:heterokaryon incompatibility protein Het-C-domain-containing protein [Cerioporus squamosus]|nr:heterokaryon incompatibility protein Het-C-domain-containing protein [Cerioporus squamosus]
MNSFTTTLLVLTVLLVLLPSETYAFGAGDIPDFAYLNGKAFRHGDIENILSELAKSVGHAGGGGGLLGLAQSVLSAAASGGGGATFSKEDVKRVYFGNWLRDYSQAMDIAGLSKLSADTLVLIVSVLGFLTFGFATEEFQVTPDRLGVYLPVEHIDNPKGYAEKEGDARQFHPKLRPPVNPQELEIDERTGMKNYMASENRGWDTSTALIRRTFRACIEHGRRAGGREGADLWEAYRLMGTGLHTMEDLLAHSNWCELALRKLGYNDVFCHVGDNVLIDTPNGRTHPLVTGTFGSADFLHSLMGEATDHLSQASVVDLSKKMDEASNQDNDTIGNLRSLISKLPIGGGDDEKMGEADDMQAKAKAYNFDPDNVAPPEVREQLWQLLKWRDDIYRDIIKKIEMVPGLSDLIENLTNALNAFVYAVLAPYVAPILKQVTEVLTEGSKAVIDTEDQYQVFDDPNASDPSHSLLSKDHFALILNEPAGKIALVVVQHSVKLLVQAWSDNNDPDRVIDEILEAFHHPYYATGRSRIQQEMFQALQNWLTSLENVDETIQALTKESVRAGKNKRQGSDDDMANSTQEYGGRVTQSSGGGQYGSGRADYGSSQSQQTYGSSGGYGSSESRRYGGDSGQTYGSSEQTYGASEQISGGGYGGSRRGEYGQPEEPRRSHRQQDESSGYESRRQEEPAYGRESAYGGDQSSYGRREEPSYGRREEPTYGRGEETSYGGSEEPSYGRREESNAYGGGRREEESYGSRPSYGEEERPRYHHAGGGFGGEERREEYGGGRGGSGGNEYEAPRREEGFGGGRREERSEYGRSGGGYGEGYAPSYGGGGDQSEGGGFGGRREEGGYGGREEGGYGGGIGDGRRGFGGDGGYGRPEEPRGYGGDGGETYGVESLSLGGEERHGRHHGGHHHKRDDSD